MDDARIALSALRAAGMVTGLQGVVLRVLEPGTMQKTAAGIAIELVAGWYARSWRPPILAARPTSTMPT